MDSFDQELSKYEQALHYEIFVKEEYAIAKAVIQKAKLIFDLGGHIGFFSEWCLSLNPQLSIHFFEPFPQNLERARQRLGKRGSQIIYHPYAIAKEEGNQIFSFNPEKTMQSSRDASFLNPRGETQELACLSLENIMKSVGKIDLLKIDIEGMEFEVLESLGKQDWGKIDALLCEIHCFDEEKNRAWEELQMKLKSVFSSVEWIPIPYSEKLGLCFCQKNL